MIYFTSDNHYFHKNIIKYQPDTRAGYLDINEAMVEKHNQTVSDKDTVWFLGDFSFGNKIKTDGILSRLNGKLNLIRGNHDHWLKYEELHRYFESIQDYKVLRYEKQLFVLFHYPITQWDRMQYGAFHLYGHVHGRFQNHGRSMDVGIDTRTDLGLWSINEVIDRLKDRPIIPHGDGKCLM